MNPRFQWMFDDPVWMSQRLLVGVVIVTLVFSGPLVPGLSFSDSGPPTSIGDGNATVSSVSVDADSVAITPGRFGTDVLYLRAPDASVEIGTVTGTPRIVYILAVPDLDAEITATRPFAEAGRLTVRPKDRAFQSGDVDKGRYRGNLTVRIQSLSTDRTVYRQSVTVEVQR